MYQWGRKDAFPGADGSTIISDSYSGVSTIPIFDSNGNPLIEGSENGLLLEMFTESMLTDNHTVVYATKHPLSYIYISGGTLKDWYTNSVQYQNSTLWADGEMEKSIYDPCPDGWRITSNRTWDDYSTSNAPYYIQGVQSTSKNNNYATNGILYNHITWYPAGGYRLTTSGMLNSVGIGGYSWSTTPAALSANNLEFSLAILNTQDVSARSYGLPVRCVQE